MDQKGFSGRDLTQIGRDFTQKLFELSLSQRNSSQINILNQNDSEINAYLAAWEKLSQEQKVRISIDYINNIKETDYERTSIESITSGLSEKFFWVISAVIIVSLYLFTLYPSSKNFIEKTEYLVFKSAISTSCKYLDKTWQASENCFSSRKSDDSPKFEYLIRDDFKNYQSSTLRFIIFWIGMPGTLSWLVSELLVAPISYFGQLKYKEVRLENDRAKQAKTQTARILFNLLSDYEQSLVRDKISEYKLNEISAMAAIKDYYEIYLSNKTEVRLSAAIRYEDLNNNWITAGWYNLDPEDSFLVARTRNNKYYCYAESIAELGNRSYWSGSALSLPIRESDCNYGFFEGKVSSQGWGRFTQSFTSTN